MSTLVGRNLENGHSGMSSYLSNNKPVDVTSVMNSLDFFGPGQPNSLAMSSNWPLANENTLNGNHAESQTLMDGTGQDLIHGGNYPEQSGHNDHPTKSSSNPADNNSGSIGGALHNSTDSSTLSATAQSVEDLELQVINAKMETQMLENQLNAVIKRNRRKLYA